MSRGGCTPPPQPSTHLHHGIPGVTNKLMFKISIHVGEPIYSNYEIYIRNTAFMPNLELHLLSNHYRVFKATGPMYCT
jgi:hypothetical protein